MAVARVVAAAVMTVAQITVTVSAVVTVGHIASLRPRDETMVYEVQ